MRRDNAVRCPYRAILKIKVVVISLAFLWQNSSYGCPMSGVEINFHSGEIAGDRLEMALQRDGRDFRVASESIIFRSLKDKEIGIAVKVKKMENVATIFFSGALGQESNLAGIYGDDLKRLKEAVFNELAWMIGKKAVTLSLGDVDAIITNIKGLGNIARNQKGEWALYVYRCRGEGIDLGGIK